MPVVKLSHGTRVADTLRPVTRPSSSTVSITWSALIYLHAITISQVWFCTFAPRSAHKPSSWPNLVFGISSWPPSPLGCGGQLTPNTVVDLPNITICSFLAYNISCRLKHWLCHCAFLHSNQHLFISPT